MCDPTLSIRAPSPVENLWSYWGELREGGSGLLAHIVFLLRPPGLYLGSSNATAPRSSRRFHFSQRLKEFMQVSRKCCLSFELNAQNFQISPPLYQGLEMKGNK